MARKDSNKSSKSRPAGELEPEPVKELVEIPIALVEIRDLAAECRTDWDMEAPKGRQAIKKRLGQVVALVDSCIQTIKAEGLRGFCDNFDLTPEEKEVIEGAMNYAAVSDSLGFTPKQKDIAEGIGALMGALRLHDAGQSIPNPRPETDSEEANEAAPSKEEWIGAQPPGGVRTCRVCRCTDHDCRQCIEKTGQPCHWVEVDLCSACVPENKSSEVIVEGAEDGKS